MKNVKMVEEIDFSNHRATSGFGDLNWQNLRNQTNQVLIPLVAFGLVLGTTDIRAMLWRYCKWIHWNPALRFLNVNINSKTIRVRCTMSKQCGLCRSTVTLKLGQITRVVLVLIQGSKHGPIAKGSKTKNG